MLDLLYPKKSQKRIFTFFFIQIKGESTRANPCGFSHSGGGHSHFFPLYPDASGPFPFHYLLRNLEFTFFSVCLSELISPHYICPFIYFLYTYFLIWIQFAVLPNQNCLCILLSLPLLILSSKEDLHVGANISCNNLQDKFA